LGHQGILPVKAFLVGCSRPWGINLALRSI
jgi:hypothetical protein